MSVQMDVHSYMRTVRLTQKVKEIFLLVNSMCAECATAVFWAKWSRWTFFCCFLFFLDGSPHVFHTGATQSYNHSPSCPNWLMSYWVCSSTFWRKGKKTKQNAFWWWCHICSQRKVRLLKGILWRSSRNMADHSGSGLSNLGWGVLFKKIKINIKFETKWRCWSFVLSCTAVGEEVAWMRLLSVRRCKWITFLKKWAIFHPPFVFACF